MSRAAAGPRGNTAACAFACVSTTVLRAEVLQADHLPYNTLQQGRGAR